jgi:general secretion pathway protein G
MPAARNERRVFFPWEKRQGLGALLSRGRVRLALPALALVALFLILRARERHTGEVRATRVMITTTMKAISAWRSDHEHGCPATLADLVAGGYLHHVPRDAWGHPLRVACPGRKDPKGFEVSSDGPDGEPGGLDRVE